MVAKRQAQEIVILKSVENGTKITLEKLKEEYQAIFKVQSGNKYRFRIISASFTACAIQVSIENHLFSVISTDGHTVIPSSNLEALVLYPGFIILSIKIFIIFIFYK